MQTSWLEVRYNHPAQVAPLSQQRADSTSLYHHYRDLIHLRQSFPALHLGQLARTAWQEDELVSFYRITDDQRLLVVHDLSDAPLSYPGEMPSARLLMGSGSWGEIGAYASQIWALE